MKNKIWLLQIPIVLLCTLAFTITEQSRDGDLNPSLVKVSYPLRKVEGLLTDIKFHLRGPMPPKNKIVVVAIDSPSISDLGRWPWHRDLTAYLIDRCFQYGAKVVGLDMVLSEPDTRVPPELGKLLQEKHMGELIPQFETDNAFTKLVAAYQDKLVLGWMTEDTCQPAYDHECAKTLDPKALAENVPPGFDKYAISHFSTPYGFDPMKTAFLEIPAPIANIQDFQDVSLHAGYLNIHFDPDSIIRRAELVDFIGTKPYPSLALAMASVGTGDDVKISLDKAQHIDSIQFTKAGQAEWKVPVSPMGVMEMNFRGPSSTFQYLSAEEVLRDGDTIAKRDGTGRQLASVSKADLLKDAYVLIGATAIGVNDLRAFPFDPYMPGTEGQATILDNLLAHDPILHDTAKAASAWIYLLMIVGALVFAYFTQKLESIPALLLFVFAMGGFGVFDQKALFDQNINWNTSFLYIEFASIFFFTLAMKYVIEERNKKFIRGAFAKYVSPAIVDSILKDPTKLSLGGEKKELTILFSDIRGFTTFSERMDAKSLAGFLNDYLGMMTDLVFANGGTLDKYIGDAVMAFWGAPLDQPLHAANACKAAITMMQALAKNRERFKTQYGVDVNIGIGINSGPVNVGNMGSQTIFEYTVIGDHVNLASRLEGLTKYYSVPIVTTRFTFDLIEKAGQGLPAHRVLDSVKVKGKKNTVELIQVLDREYDPEGLKLFAEARGHYSKQQWDLAIEKFKMAGQALGGDGPSEMYVARCLEFKEHPPGQDWDGSWEMHSK